MKNKNTVFSLQILRVFAALIVIMFHIIYIFEEKMGVFGLKVLFNFGKSGVHLFFVLSGFVMYNVHKGDIGSGLKAAKSFAWKRFVRIYPTYWVLTTLTLIAMVFISGEVKAYKYNFLYIFQSYSLTELGLMKGLPIIPPAWSLFHEIKFYAFFLLLILIKHKTARWALIFSAVLLTLCNTLPLNVISSEVAKFYFSDLNFLFVLGVLSAWVTERYYFVFNRPVYLLPALAFFAIIATLCNVHSWKDSIYTDFLFGLSAFALITSLACYEAFCCYSLRRNPFKAGKRLLYMADASYCLYLIHIPVYLIVYILNKHIGLSHFPFIVLMLLSAIAASLVYYKIVEYPLINLLRKGYNRKQRPVISVNPELTPEYSSIT